MTGRPSTRRRFLQGLGGVAAGSVVVTGATGVSRGESHESWSQFGYDVANSGHAPDNAGPVSDVQPLWSFPTDFFRGLSPAAVDGTVYVGGDDGVHAINAADGTRQWTFEKDGALFSSPTVADGTVYVGGGRSIIRALDAADGTERWAVRTEAGVESAPVVVDGTVYVGTVGNNKVYALDSGDGTEQWSFETNRSVWSSPAVAGDTLYIGSDDGNLYALDAGDGTEKWSFRTGGLRSSPAVVDDTVYVGGENRNVYAIDAAEGTERWSFGESDAAQSSPAVANGVVYIGSRDGNVYALDAADGTERWSFQTDDVVRSAPAVADGTVYVGSSDNNVYALDAAEGTERWSVRTGGLVRSSPAVANGAVYVGSHDGHVYSFVEEDDVPAGVSATVHTSETASTPTAPSSVTRTNVEARRPGDGQNETEIPLSALGIVLGGVGFGVLLRYMWKGNVSDRRGPASGSSARTGASTHPGDTSFAGGPGPDSGDRTTPPGASDTAREDSPEISRQQLEAEAVAIRRELDRADTLIENGDSQQARDTLIDLEVQIASALELASERDFDTLRDDIVELGKQQADLLSRVDE
jgi:outer membrane protein assembly factor BamB